MWRGGSERNLCAVILSALPCVPAKTSVSAQRCEITEGEDPRLGNAAGETNRRGWEEAAGSRGTRSSRTYRKGQVKGPRKMRKLGSKRTHGICHAISTSYWALEAKLWRFKSCWWHLCAVSVMLGKTCWQSQLAFKKIEMQPTMAVMGGCCPPVVNPAFSQESWNSTWTVELMALISKHTTRPGFYVPVVTNAPW